MVLFTVMIITSCEFPDVVTILWEPDGSATNYRQFSTNDRNNCSSFFLYPAAPMTTEAEVDVKKITGYAYAGYGIIFCYQDPDNYYKLLIHVDGKYRVSEVKSGVSRLIVDWSSSILLNTGWETINTLRVEHDGAGTFDIYFNGTRERDFSVNPYFSNGSVGYYVAVEHPSFEYFPYYPVDVRFKKQLPLPTDP
jgi:hypothetical protein